MNTGLAEEQELHGGDVPSGGGPLQRSVGQWSPGLRVSTASPPLKERRRLDTPKGRTPRSCPYSVSGVDGGAPVEEELADLAVPLFRRLVEWRLSQCVVLRFSARWFRQTTRPDSSRRPSRRAASSPPPAPSGCHYTPLVRRHLLCAAGFQRFVLLEADGGPALGK